MLADLFVRSLHLAQASPHAADLEAFAAHLRVVGYAPRSVQRHVRRLHAALGTTAMESGSTLAPSQLKSIFAGRPGRGYYGTERLFSNYLLKRGRVVVPVAPVEPRYALKEQHLKRLVELRGLAPNTVIYLNWALTDFLSRVLAPDASPRSLTSEAIDQFFRERGPQLARRTFHHTVCAVRSYLRYGFECGALLHPLHVFELPKSFRFEQPPRALPWRHVLALLASMDRTSAIGRRDHTMVHLLAVYGLRPGEVASLTIGSIDWQAGTLRVEQSKTYSTLLLPLAPSTLELLDDHLRERRKEPPDRPVFLCVHPPFGPMNGALVSVCFKAAARAAAYRSPMRRRMPCGTRSR